MQPIRTKICGITNVADALVAATAGADALGLVFYPPSSRFVDLDSAQSIALSVGPFVTLTALFVDADPEVVRSVLNKVPINLLQFHGDESPSYCESFARPYIKAMRMRPDLDVVAEINKYPSATGILLDAYRPGVPGGTGEVFDWARVPLCDKPIVLAGGLTPENVQKAIESTSIYGVDVSGGVELAPGKKDQEKIKRFITNARSARR